MVYVLKHAVLFSMQFRKKGIDWNFWIDKNFCHHFWLKLLLILFSHISASLMLNDIYGWTKPLKRVAVPCAYPPSNNPINKVRYQQNPEKAHLCAERHRSEWQIVKISQPMRSLTKGSKKKNKKRNLTVANWTGYLSWPPTLSDQNSVWHSRVVVSNFIIIGHVLSKLCMGGVENWPFVLHWQVSTLR